MEQASAIAATAEAMPLEGRARAELNDFDSLVRSEQQRVYRLLMLMVRDEEAAGTLTQDCFIRVFETRDTFRGECSVQTWVLRIAINLARDFGRNRRLNFWRKLFRSRVEPEELGAVADPVASPERTLAARQQLAAVLSDVDDLSPQQRAVFTLRFVQDMSIEEIALVTGLRAGTVKSHLSRALAMIRTKAKERERP